MDCLPLPEISLDEFSRRLLQQPRLPLSGSLELTARCNLQCAHCYLNLPATDRAVRGRELDLPEWRRIIAEIAAEGCLNLLFTGGEIFLRPDFPEIYLFAKQQGLLITLFTNGTLITKTITDLLAEFPPYKMEITVYGRTRETHEAVTRVPGSYDQCLAGIQQLLEHRIPLSLKTMVMTLNYHELGALADWAAALGLDFRFDAALSPRLDGSRKPCRLRISPEQAVALDLADPKRLAAWQDYLDKFSGPPAEPDKLFRCGAGLFAFHIDSYGSLSPCLMARTPGYSLLQGSFAEGWGTFIPQLRQQKRQKDDPCAHCDLISLCSSCPGWAQLELGQWEGRVDYLCHTARLLAEALGVTSKPLEENYA